MGRPLDDLAAVQQPSASEEESEESSGTSSDEDDDQGWAEEGEEEWVDPTAGGELSATLAAAEAGDASELDRLADALEHLDVSLDTRVGAHV